MRVGRLRSVKARFTRICPINSRRLFTMPSTRVRVSAIVGESILVPDLDTADPNPHELPAAVAASLKVATGLGFAMVMPSV